MIGLIYQMAFGINLEFKIRSKKKQVGLFDIENIDEPNIKTIALNPKEYYGKINNRTDKKKQKGLKNQPGEWILILTLKD